MHLDRGALFGALVGGLVVAVLLAALPAIAGNGDIMYVGQRNNAIRATKLTSKGGLQLNVGKPGNPALTINVADTTTPPIAVNSPALVTDLNADLLDGVEASGFAGSDEGLRGDRYVLDPGQSVTVATVGPWTVWFACSADPDPPFGRTARLELAIDGMDGYFATPFQQGALSAGTGQSLMPAFENPGLLNLLDARLDAIAEDGTLLRVVGAVWVGDDNGDCGAALQVVPDP